MTFINSEFRKKARQLTVFVFVAILIFWLSYLWGTGEIETAAETQMKAFTLILWSILLEALPFVMLGTIISSLIQIFVSEEIILKILPKRNIPRLIFSACVGFVFPVCECAIIPITRGLIKKGMPVGAAVTFMIATPIVNPVVLFSTYKAFSAMPQMVIYRGVFGFLGAIIIGFLVGRNSDKNVLKQNREANDDTCGCGHVHDINDEIHEREGGHDKKKKTREAFMRVIAHTSHEVQEVGGYLIIGAIIATCMQVFVPKDALLSVGNGRLTSIVVMMSLAFVLSLCSEADAFIANTFMLRFIPASVLAFLITGPMIDIKNSFMLFGSFKTKFSIKTVAAILVVCFVLAVLASFIMGDMYA